MSIKYRIYTVPVCFGYLWELHIGKYISVWHRRQNIIYKGKKVQSYNLDSVQNELNVAIVGFTTMCVVFLF